MKTQNFILFVFIITHSLLVYIKTSMTLQVDTRNSPDFQFGGTDEQFATRLKNYVENSPQSAGYCTFQNPSYPIKNGQACGATRDIGYLWQFNFDEPGPDINNYRLQFGTDFGGGAAIYVDGVFDRAYQDNFWWGYDWNSPGVFHLNTNFGPGLHQIYVIGNDNCCDGDFVIRFSINDQPFKELTQENFDCAQTNNCPGVTCGSNQWQNGWECIDCSHKCNTCVNNDVCRTCSDTNRTITDCNCNDGYYNQGTIQTCQQCKINCKTCSNGSSCDTCNYDYYLLNDSTDCVQCQITYGVKCGTCNQFRCNTCKVDPTFTLPNCTNTNCENNQYKVGVQCFQCQTQCATCTDSTQCISCIDGKYLHNGNCISCQDTYGSLCGTCNNLQCLTCLNNSSYKLPICTSSECLPGQTENNNTCYGCEANCVACATNINECTDCIDGYFLNSGDCIMCTPPCLTCGSTVQCNSCVKPNFIVISGCIQCISGYYENFSGFCVQCSSNYGSNCAQCNINECTECQNNPLFKLPLCIQTTCGIGLYADDNICRECLEECYTCSNGMTCGSCYDLNFLDASDSRCKPCTPPCFLCENSGSNCIVCDIVGWEAPTCTTCQNNWFMYQNQCVQACPPGQYGDRNDQTCKICIQQCLTCDQTSDQCLSCYEDKFLYQNQCLDCNSIPGYEQIDQQQGSCRAICGDGLRQVNDGYTCDDGNNLNNDGCNENCQIEEGWICEYDDQQQKDQCFDKRPIGFSVEFNIDDQYLNIEQQDPISCLISFNKTFTIISGQPLVNLAQIYIDHQLVQDFKLEIKQINNYNRFLINANSQNMLTFNVTITPNKTMKNRKISLDINPKSDIDDGSGNKLVVSQSKQQGQVKEYYYYNETERKNTQYFEIWTEIGILIVMLFLPFYVFYYQNHFNKFSEIFIIIDLTQILYFYRFLNIRWPINGIKFFRKLRPVISFYMWNFYDKEIKEEDFQYYSSGVKKFDNERESALFLNNTGSLLTLLFILIGLYSIVVLFSQKKLYKNIENSKIYYVFYELRFGYFQWGIWFDCMLASSGVFIIYIILQMTNTYSILNFILAVIIGLFYTLFFCYTLIYTHKNKKNLYTQVLNEPVDGIKLEDKIKNNPTFKFRNIWHFIDKINDTPNKAYFYFVFILRKIYIAITLLSLQESHTIQLSMLAFSHLVIILMFIKYQFYQDKKETFRVILSEFLVLSGLGCMYYMLNDESEDESFRLYYSWYVLSLFLLALLIHFLFFCWSLIFNPILDQVYSYKSRKKISDLRILRQQGRQKVILDNQLQDEDEHQQPRSSRIILSEQNLQQIDNNQENQYQIQQESIQSPTSILNHSGRKLKQFSQKRITKSPVSSLYNASNGFLSNQGTLPNQSQQEFNLNNLDQNTSILKRSSQYNDSQYNINFLHPNSHSKKQLSHKKIRTFQEKIQFSLQKE